MTYRWSLKTERNTYAFFSLTNAFVTFGDWQHLCFSIDTQSKLWRFFKDGLMTNIGSFNLSKSYVIDESASDNVIKLGEVGTMEKQ